MNNRTLRVRVGAVLLVLALCLTVLPAAAASGSMQTVYLDSAEEFAAFAKNCSLDTWSQGKTFILRADISLSGVDFTPAASFGGTFEGRGHTISDFNLTENASPAGLFGTILPGGRVANLNVAGSVAAGGDKIACGGIAGENYGKIVCCTFTGMVQGDTQIGGIVGRNQASGQIVSCSFEGKVQGTTATGGIAGQNGGTIRHCTNTGSVNIDNIDSALSLSDIQIDTTLDLANLATTQTFLTTTATGGIAGRNTGLIAVCENTGTVGYEHVGYNVGGIAGVTSGYLLNNTNSGTIYGRKDVGGIAGQVEPYVAVTVSESTKQQLQDQLQELKTLTDQATADAGGAASDLGSQLAGMGAYLDSAANAANNLRATATIDAGALANGGVSGGADLTVGDASAGIGAVIGAGADGGVSVDTHPLEIEGHKDAGIGAGVGGFVDPSDISISGGTDGSGALSASLQMNADASMPELAGALSGMGAQMRAIGSQAANLSETLQKDVQAVSDKLDEISTTVFDAMDSLENRDLVTDGSQTDPDSITMGALRGCENTGAVQADRNVGGIAGAMGMEAGADPESDVSQRLSTTERKQYELRAVLQRCVSSGAVTAKKDCAAAICGRMDLGLIDGCEAYGSVESQSGDYVGGVAGICSAVIENCWAKCTLSGGRYVGGITGTGVTDSVTGSGSTVSGCTLLFECVPLVADFLRSGFLIIPEVSFGHLYLRGLSQSQTIAQFLCALPVRSCLCRILLIAMENKQARLSCFYLFLDQNRFCRFQCCLLAFPAEICHRFKLAVFAKLLEVFILHQVVIVIPIALGIQRFFHQSQRFLCFSAQCCKAISEIVKLRLVCILYILPFLFYQFIRFFCTCSSSSSSA